MSTPLFSKTIPEISADLVIFLVVVVVGGWT